jgi:hypothetical protein
MVLIVKATNNRTDDFRLLAKQMVNMETNQLIYDSEGNPTGEDLKDTKRQKFNVYTHNSVDFEFSLTFGIIVLYTQSRTPLVDYSKLIAEEIKKLPIPASFYESIDGNSDHYTMIKTPIVQKETILRSGYENGRKCYRKILLDSFYLKRALSSNSANFVWLVIVKTSGTNFRGSYLKIPEVDPSIPSEMYLNRSVCTIIYDELDIFKSTPFLKQLDYPSLDQYSMVNRIVQDPIYISWTGGLRFEIFRQFTGEIPTFYWIDDKSEVYKSMLPVATDKKFEEVELKRRNPDSDWKKQLLDPFDYKNQEEDEITLVAEGKPVFRNDICFISGIPLWEEFYMVRVANEHGEFDIAVAPSVFHSSTKNKSMNIRKRINTVDEKVNFQSVRVCSHPRTFVEVLDMLDIDPVKKNIMRCMEFYGCYSKANDCGNKCSGYSTYARQYYVKDKISNQIYVGTQACNDWHIATYQNSKTILFQVIVVEAYPY